MPYPRFSILVRMPNWLGDCVMAMPALRHLVETLPGANIHLAGREPFRELFLAQPGVAGFVPAPASGFRPLIRGMIGTRRTIGEAGLGGGIDMGILLTNSFSTAAWLWRTGARVRIGYNRDGRRLFLTHPVPCGGLESSWHFVRYYIWLAKFAEAVAEESDAVDSRQVAMLKEYLVPTLAVGESARHAAAEALRAADLYGEYAVIAPASAYGEVKDWPPAHYRELVRMINRKYGLPVVVTGAAGQAGVCRDIAADQQAAVSLAGRTSLDAFAGLLAGASLFVGGDSGGAHVAGALGIPAVVIFGVTNPSRTRPGGPRVASLGEGENVDVRLNTPEAREAAKRALSAITPEQTIERLDGLLAEQRLVDA